MITVKKIYLAPLTDQYVSELEDNCRETESESIWKYLFDSNTYYEYGMSGLVSNLLEESSIGKTLPFAIIYKPTQTAIGCTRFVDIDLNNRSAEKFTWISSKFQRQGIGTFCNYLMLTHAFEVLNLHRIQYKVDTRNMVSRRAIEAFGITKEGICREHTNINEKGGGTYRRSSVIYSVIKSEWPSLKDQLEQRLNLVTTSEAAPESELT